MLGGRLVTFHDPPIPDAPAERPSLDQVLPGVSLAGVEDLYLGFPIWGEAPSPPIIRLVESLRLEGVRVIPFYTFIHFVEPKSLAGLRDAITRAGGSPAEEMAFLIPLAVSDEDLAQRAQRTLLARPDLWASPGAQPTPECAANSGAADLVLCRVPRGFAWLGDNARPGSPPGHRPPRRVAVASFEISQTEVTVGQYSRCAAASACRAIDFGQTFCRVLLAEAKSPAALPVPCATVDDAEAFCRWAGLRLPTEAEWVRAARGEASSAYPWGESFGDIARANVGEKPSTGFPGYSVVDEDRAWQTDGYRGLAPPCSFDAGISPFGVCDQVGNLAEWVAPEGAVDAGADFAMGGSWLDGEAAALRLGSRARVPRPFSRTSRMYLTGIRCAQSAPEATDTRGPSSK
jgi:formylglycine-generating enzyme required for sulfatase activity